MKSFVSKQWNSLSHSVFQATARLSGRRWFWTLSIPVSIGVLLFVGHFLSFEFEMNQRLSDGVWRQADAHVRTMFGRHLTLQSVDQLIANKEAAFELGAAGGARIRDGHRKKIHWVENGGRKKTKWSVVYLHGFSAGPLELEPTISKFAARLGANLYATRLAAHGLSSGEAFATVTATGWVHDVLEAVEIGRLIGENILLMGTSTGAALAIRYADYAQSSGASIGAMILLSPNYQVSAFGADLLGNHLGPVLAKIMVGTYREFAAENELHRSRWTTKYRSEALKELVLVAKAAREVEIEKLTIPVLTVFTKKDRVVSVAEIESRAKRFRHSHSQTIDWEAGQRHELASETFNPEKVEALVALMSEWAVKLEIGPGKDQNEAGH